MIGGNVKYLTNHHNSFKHITVPDLLSGLTAFVGVGVCMGCVDFSHELLCMHVFS